MKFAINNFNFTFFLNGCDTNKFVSYPCFSALSISASLDEFSSQNLIKSKAFSSFLANFLASGCWGDIAINVAPKIVSGLVVKTSISSEVSIIENFIVAP